MFIMTRYVFFFFKSNVWISVHYSQCNGRYNLLTLCGLVDDFERFCKHLEMIIRSTEFSMGFQMKTCYSCFCGVRIQCLRCLFQISVSESSGLTSLETRVHLDSESNMCWTEQKFLSSSVWFAQSLRVYKREVVNKTLNIRNMADHEERIYNLEERTDDLEQKTDNLEKKTDELEEKTDDLERKTEEFEQKTDDLETRIQRLEERFQL